MTQVVLELYFYIGKNLHSSPWLNCRNLQLLKRFKLPYLSVFNRIQINACGPNAMHWIKVFFINTHTSG